MFSQGKHNGQSVNLGGTKQRFNYLILDSAPVFVSAVFTNPGGFNPSYVDVTFDSNIDNGTVDTSDWSIVYSDLDRTIDSISVTDNVVRLTLGSTISSPGPNTVTYVPGSMAGTNGLLVSGFAESIT